MESNVEDKAWMVEILVVTDGDLVSI